MFEVCELILDEREPLFDLFCKEYYLTREEINEKLSAAESRRNHYLQARIMRSKKDSAAEIAAKKAKIAALKKKQKDAEKRRTAARRGMVSKAQIPKPKQAPSTPMTAKCRPSLAEVQADAKLQALNKKQEEAEERRRMARGVRPATSTMSLNGMALLSKSMAALVAEEQDNLHNEQEFQRYQLNERLQRAASRRRKVNRPKVVPKNYFRN